MFYFREKNGEEIEAMQKIFSYEVNFVMLWQKFREIPSTVTKTIYLSIYLPIYLSIYLSI